VLQLPSAGLLRLMYTNTRQPSRLLRNTFPLIFGFVRIRDLFLVGREGVDEAVVGVYGLPG
jgi:hypothetical protein